MLKEIKEKAKQLLLKEFGKGPSTLKERRESLFPTISSLLEIEQIDISKRELETLQEVNSKLEILIGLLSQEEDVEEKVKKTKVKK